jgi:hypothetical protein
MRADFGRRFDELFKQAEAIESAKTKNTGDFGWGYNVDSEQLMNWRVKARHLLALACGAESQHFRQFVESEKPQSLHTNHAMLRDLRAIFLAAKEDYEGGYLNSLKVLVQGEVFDSELEQATELLSSGYTLPAAVVAGVVLETGLREMCTDEGIAVGKLDKMNADLAKAGVYSKLIQKQITAIADIRNSAAHGHPEKFTREDVEGMIRDVRRILADRAA